MGEESRAREGQAGIEPKPVQAKCHLPVPAAPWTLTGQAWFRGEGRKPSLQHLEVTPVARIRVHQGPELHQTPPHLLIPLPGAQRRGEGVLSRRAGGAGVMGDHGEEMPTPALPGVASSTFSSRRCAWLMRCIRLRSASFFLIFFLIFQHYYTEFNCAVYLW